MMPAFVLLPFAIATLAHALPATKPAPRAVIPSSVVQEALPDGIINDSWYTMQAGSTPFGYFHEIIEARSGRLAYRYAMTKVENNILLEENIGAIAMADLTPVAFNLNKSGAGATESTDATYSTNKNGGNFSVQISGAKAANFKRGCTPGTILDVFFPLWLKRNWDKLKPGYRGWVNTFAEDPEHSDFRARMVRFEVKNQNAALDCLNIFVQMDSIKGDWCMKPSGVLVDLKVGSYHVRRVSGETEAKGFVSGILPKRKSGN